MKWASRFQFFNKTLIVDLNTGAAIVTIQTDPMAIEVMVAAVVEVMVAAVADTAEIRIDTAIMPTFQVNMALK